MYQLILEFMDETAMNTDFQWTGPKGRFLQTDGSWNHTLNDSNDLCKNIQFVCPSRYGHEIRSICFLKYSDDSLAINLIFKNEDKDADVDEQKKDIRAFQLFLEFHDIILDVYSVLLGNSYKVSNQKMVKKLFCFLYRHNEFVL
jgi:hypothetical protein